MKTLTFTLFFFLIASLAYANDWLPGEEFIDSRDGNTYKTAVFGNQVWMTENMNIGTLTISDKTGALMNDDGIIEKYCWENALNGCDGNVDGIKRGGFYEWQEAMQYYSGQPTLPVQGICPEGWHIPSNADWNELFNYFVNTYNATTYPLLAQCMLKGGESGFDALLTGYRCTMTGGFRVSALSEDTRTYYYTAEQTDNDMAPAIEIGAESFTMFNIPKSIGLCIRCILDEKTADINEDQSKASDLKVFPNPASDHILLFGVEQNTQVRIISLAGKVMISTNYNSQLDISHLDQGIYLVIVNDTILKFIKI